MALCDGMRFPLVFSNDWPLSKIGNRRDFFLLPDGDYIFFGHGAKDAWAAPVMSTKMRAFDNTNICAMATDKHYFELLRILVDKAGVDRDFLYEYISILYDNAGLRLNLSLCRQVCNDVQLRLTAGSVKYSREISDLTCRALMHLYYGFVAENYYAGSMLGPTIKMNAVWEVLYEGLTLVQAADRVRGMGWENIKAFCESHGVYPPKALLADGVDLTRNIGRDKIADLDKQANAIVSPLCPDVSYLPTEEEYYNQRRSVA